MSASISTIIPAMRGTELTRTQTALVAAWRMASIL